MHTRQRRCAVTALLVLGLLVSIVATTGHEPAAAASDPARLVADINPAGMDSAASAAIGVGDSAYFLAGDQHGVQLWRTGSAGVVPLKTVATAPQSDNRIIDAARVGGSDYLVLRAGPGPYDLWRTDGTAAGTYRLRDVLGVALWGEVWEVAELAGVLYLVASDAFSPQSDQELWRSDGTAGGTARLTDWDFGGPAKLTAVDDRLYFSTNASTTRDQLWESDGTVAGTRLVRDFSPDGSLAIQHILSVGTSLRVTTYAIGSFGSRWVFWQREGSAGELSAALDSATIAPAHVLWHVAQSPAGLMLLTLDRSTGWAIWRSDGTRAGTVLLKDGLPFDRVGGQSPGPFGLSVAGGAYFFAAVDGDGLTYRLWRSDGTEGNAQPLQVIGRSDSFSFQIASAGERLVFTAYEATLGCEPWSVGATDAPALLRDIVPGPASSQPVRMAGGAGHVYFAAEDVAHGRELWVSDGTPAGTALVYDVNQNTLGSNPAELTALDGHVYFAAEDVAHGRELWVSDGTAAGTTRFADLATGSASSNPSRLTAAGRSLYFVADGGAGRALWAYDSVARTTLPILIEQPGQQIEQLVAVGERLFFFSRFTPYNETFLSLWVTDGTTAGTVHIDEFRQELLRFAAPTGGRLVYGLGASHLGSGRVLASDGGSSVQLVVGPASAPRSYAAAGGRVFFTFEGEPGVWSTDGTQAGTHVARRDTIITLAEAAAAGEGYLLYDTSCALWRTDSTGRSLGPVRQFVFADGQCYPGRLTPLGGRVLLAAGDLEAGYELWRSDGTTDGTVRVRDISAGGFWATPHNLRAAGATILFAADDHDRALGAELWRSDGSAGGTALVQDVYPGSRSSEPAEMTILAEHVLFVADDGVHGRELWAVPTTTLGARVTLPLLRR